MGLTADAAEVVAVHRAAMRRFTAAGVASAVLESGASEAPAVVCLHGVAFDLPDLGVADRPVDFDYIWTGLGRFERTAEKETLYRSVVGDQRRPRQVQWGATDPTLRLRPLGELVGAVAGVSVRTVPGRHFLREDNAPAIADVVAPLAGDDLQGGRSGSPEPG